MDRDDFEGLLHSPVVQRILFVISDEQECQTEALHRAAESRDGIADTITLAERRGFITACKVITDRINEGNDFITELEVK